MSKLLAMGKSEIEKLIRKYFRANYFQDPDILPDIVIKSIEVARVTAKAFWDHRTDEEMVRDEKADVTHEDYEKWVLNELLHLKIGEFYN
jgi:hypothetical protein